MRKIGVAPVALLVLSLLLLPAALANHGWAALGEAEFTDGSEVRVLMRWREGATPPQVWRFDFVENGATSTCFVEGSIEMGFLGRPDCPLALQVGGTEHEHAYPHVGVDRHDVPILYGARTGTLSQTHLPDDPL